MDELLAESKYWPKQLNLIKQLQLKVAKGINVN